MSDAQLREHARRLCHEQGILREVLLDRAKPSIAEEEEEYRWHVLTRLRDAGMSCTRNTPCGGWLICAREFKLLEERSTRKTSQRERIRARGGLERGAEVAFPPFPLPIRLHASFPHEAEIFHSSSHHAA